MLLCLNSLQKLTSSAQPPPTPGLASWAFNSLFNRQTPSSKYANLQKEKHRSETSTRTPRRIPRRFNDDTLLDMSNSKNVAWGGEDFKLRSRSSSFSERPVPKRFVDDDGSIHYKDSKYFRDNELLPDDVEETGYKSPYQPAMRTKSLNTRVSNVGKPNLGTYALGAEKYGTSSLPQTYPGKYPSPYVHKNSSSFDDLLLSSSAVKNLERAKSNTKLNESLTEERNRKLATTPTRKPSFKRLNRETLLEKSKTNRDIRLDEQLLLDSIDRNIVELDDITKHINGLKLNTKNDGGLEKKYKEIRQELINELRKSKKLYDSYYQFVDKYRELKKKYKESPVVDANSSLIIKSLKDEIIFYKQENELLNHRLKSKESKYMDDDSTIHKLKSELKNSSNFEVTLRRKIKYLEDKLERNDQDFKKERFQLNEKIFILETNSREEEDKYRSDLSKAEDRIRELERQLKLKSSTSKSTGNLNIIPEYTNGYRDLSNKYQLNENTIDLLEKRYPDRRLSNPSILRPSPEKRFNFGNTPTNGGGVRKRPTSLSPDFQRENRDLFNNFDESTNLTGYNKYLRDSGKRSFNGTLRTTSASKLPDLTFNSSEIG